MSFSGVHVAVVTPFRADGSLDLAGLQKHLTFLVESGVHGLVPCGTTGESPTLSRAERVQVIEACLKWKREKGVQVIAGAGGNSTSTAKELILEAEALGCDGTLVVTPYYNKPTPSGLLAHYLSLADACTKPIVLYHVPGRTSVTLPLETVSRLFDHPRITAIKEASGQYAYWLGLSQIAREKKRHVLAGDDDAFAIQQALGGTGLISASANAIPVAFVQLHSLMQQGLWERAFELQVRMAPLIRAFFAETNPAPVKYALQRFRGIGGTLRLPLVPVSEATQGLIEKEWHRLEAGAAT